MSTAATSLKPSDWALDLTNVEKVYSGSMFGRKKGVHALRGIEMRVRRGEIFGLLGPNGAGKSTLVKILMTIIRPTACKGRMLDEPVGVKSVLGRVGYLPEHHRFPDYLTGAQVLDYFGALSNVPRAQRRERAGQLLELVGMSAWGDKRVKGYSKGMRQRLGIANALMNDPELVVLDEPTDGVDPVGRKDIREVLLRLRDQGKTIFLNSHLLSELEMVCDRVAILVQGLVSAQGTMDELTRDSRRYEIEVAAEGNRPVEDPALLPAALSHLALPEPPGSPPPVARPLAPPTAPPTALSTATPAMIARLRHADVPLVIDRASITVGTDDPLVVQPLIDTLRARGFVVTAVRPVRASLEDLFMQAVTDPGTGKALAPGAARGPAVRRGEP